MLILILGVALFWGAHLFPLFAPERRAAMGKPGRGLIAAALVLSTILMIWGYKISDGPYWWGRSAAMVGINNLLIFAAFYLFAASGMKTRVTAWIRHPQLIGFSLWALAHLLVNGDLPSLILFGGLLIWALVEIVLLNRSKNWTPPTGPFPVRKEIIAVIGTIVVVAVIGVLHGMLGPQPFGA